MVPGSVSETCSRNAAESRLVPVQLDDDVSGLDASLCSGTFGGDVTDKHAAGFVHSKCLRHGWSYVLNGGAEETADDMAVVHNLIHHALGKIHGNGKTHALIPAAAGKDRGVDADQFAFRVYERAARIAGVDSCVGLNEVFIVLDAKIGAARGAHDSHGDGLADAKGIADGEREIADLYLGGIAQRNRGQVIRVNFQDGDVRLGISANDLGGEFALVTQRDFDVRRSVNHVIVGENVAVGADDYSRAQAVFFLLLRPSLGGCCCPLRVWLLVTEKLAEERIIEHVGWNLHRYV